MRFRKIINYDFYAFFIKTSHIFKFGIFITIDL